MNVAAWFTWTTRLTRIQQKFSVPTRYWNWLKASMNGPPSISPIVPPSWESQHTANIDRETFTNFINHHRMSSFTKAENVKIWSANHNLYLHNADIWFFLMTISRYFGNSFNPFLNSIGYMWNNYKPHLMHMKHVTSKDRLSHVHQQITNSWSKQITTHRNCTFQQNWYPGITEF